MGELQRCCRMEITGVADAEAQYPSAHLAILAKCRGRLFTLPPASQLPYCWRWSQGWPSGWNSLRLDRARNGYRADSRGSRILCQSQLLE